MIHIVPPAEQTVSPKGTIAFEGWPYGGDVSIFVVDAGPGEGPALHVHPYSETWVLRTGAAEMLIGGKSAIARAGDIVVIPADTPHGFKALGPERLRSHLRPRF